MFLGFESRGGGRRAFGSGFRRDYDDRRDGDRYGEDRYERRDDRREDRGTVYFRVLVLLYRKPIKCHHQITAEASLTLFVHVKLILWFFYCIDLPNRSLIYTSISCY